MISWIKDSWGTKIFKYTRVADVVLPSHVSGHELKVLGLGLERVRALVPHMWIDSQAASKTGTTNDYRTCWFLGLTPELTTGLYIGCDDNKPMGPNVYPLHTAFPIRIGLYRDIATNQKEFAFDPILKEVSIDEKTGKIAYTDRKKGVVKILIRQMQILK